MGATLHERPESTSITIDGVDSATLERLREESARRGVAVSVIAREALTKGLPPKTLPVPAHAGTVYHDLDSFAGTWSDEDAAEFESATAGLRGIDRELWE